VDRREAEAIYDAGREVVVEVLLRMDEQIRRLEERVARQDERIAQLERRLNRNSRNSSAPRARIRPAMPRSAAKIPAGETAAPNRATRDAGATCCQRAPWMG
jgi:uncharacterized coiled-coil protein SlyX